MKTILISFLFLFSVSMMGQDFVSNDTTFERQSLVFDFSNIIQVDTSMTKDKLYQKLRQWFAETYNSSKNVIDNADKDEGVIYGKGAFIMKDKQQGYVEYNISVKCKKGKVKYSLTNFNQKDALQVNAFNQSTAQSKSFDMGPLSQVESGVTYGMSGMGKGFKNKTWISIKSQSKEYSYKLIQSLKSYLEKESKGSDSW